MKQAWAVLTVLAASGCFQPVTCTDDSQCRGDVCDPVLKVCIAATDGGGAGGGGGTTDCAQGCEAWQTCQPGNGGTCRDVTVTIDSPMDGAEFGAGAQVRVVARVTQWDGGGWLGASIPASATGGATAPTNLTRNGNTFEGDFGLPMTAGMPTLTAGWAATSDSVAVLVKACAVMCQPWQECRPSADGGSCGDLGLQLAWTRPTAGEEFGPGASAAVPLELSVTRADGGAFGGTVPFVLLGRAGGTLTPSGASWVGSVDAGPQDGMRTVIAGWDAGPAQASRSFAIVATPPTVQVFAQAAPVRPADDTDTDGVARWKKYELAPIQVESNRPLAAIAPGNFANPGVTLSTRCTRTCMTAYCQCFEVDLAQQVLTAAAGELSGTVTVTLNSATDVYGNTASGIAPVQVPVTRFKWKRSISSGTATTPVAIAVLDGGVVLAGVTTAPTAGANASLTAFKPDGGVAWTNSYSTEAITAGPLVGTQGIYFGVYAPGTTPIASIRRVDTAGMSASPLCLNIQSFTGDMALVSPGAGENVVAVRSDSFVVPTASGCVPGSFTPSAGTPSSANRPTIVVSGTDAFVGMGQRAPIWKFTAANATPTAAGSVSTQTLFPSNLFVVGTDIVGGGGGPTVGGAFVFRNPAGSLSGMTTNATPGNDPGGAAVVGGTTASPVVHYGDTAGAERRVVLEPQGPSFGAADAGQLGTASFADRAPVVGAGGRLYVVGSDGALRVLSSSTLAEEWRWDNAFPTTAISQLNLDINRDVGQPCGAGQPGVLYVAASSGAATWLYAVLVDSAGLDRNAPWPRHQHDPANTGNPATPLTPWTCPP